MENVDLRDMPHESAEDLNKHLISRAFYDLIYNSYENFIRGNNSDFPELKKKMSTLINFCMWGDLMFVDLLFVTALGDVQEAYNPVSYSSPKELSAVRKARRRLFEGALKNLEVYLDPDQSMVCQPYKKTAVQLYESGCCGPILDSYVDAEILDAEQTDGKFLIADSNLAAPWKYANPWGRILGKRRRYAEMEKYMDYQEDDGEIFDEACKSDPNFNPYE